MFARFKMLTDPMFPRLYDFVKSPKTIIDVGCGYAVPAVWLLEVYPDAYVYGLDPDSERTRVASIVIGNRGEITTAGVPDIPHLSEKADTAFMLDMIHILSDDQLKETFRKLHESMVKGGRLIIRATVPSDKKLPWERWIEKIRLAFSKTTSYFRSAEKIQDFLRSCGFEIINVESTSENREETWIISTAGENQV